VLAGFSLGQYILEGLLSWRQYKVLQRTKPPKVLEGEVSQKVFDESQVCLILYTDNISALFTIILLYADD